MAKRHPSDTVAFLAQTYTVPGGNGLPSLEISPLTPMDYVESQIAARVPSSEADATPARPAGIVDDILHPADALQETLQNVAVFSSILLLGLALTALGVWQLTRE